MNKLTNKLRAIVAIAMMLIVGLNAGAIDFSVNGLYYKYHYNGDVAEAWITWYDSYPYSDSKQTTFEIPAEVTYQDVTYPITGIDSGTFAGYEELETIIIPESVKYVGDRAFQGCVNLNNVNLPGVTTIAEGAFGGCESLESVTLGNELTLIGGYAFQECTNLSSIYIPSSVNSIGKSAFKGCPLTEIKIDALTAPAAETSSFSSYDASLYVQLSAAISYFQHEVWGKFNITGNLTYSITSDTTVAVAKNSNYTYYKYVKIPETVEIDGKTYSVTSIANTAFKNCTGLTSVIIGNSVTSIGGVAFSGCTGLTSVVWNAINCAIGSYAYATSYPFYGSNNITSFTFGDSVQYIPARLCREMSKLTSVTIGNSVISIGNYAFEGCSGLTSELVIPNSVTSIGICTFHNCTGLTSVTIGNSVTSIGQEVFKNCTGLTSVTIGNSVTSIVGSAFNGCTGLTSIVWNAIKYNDSDYSPFSSFAANITSFTFGDSVEHIPAHLCQNMSNLTSIEIPNSVTSIGSSAFHSCSGLIGELVIPNSVTSIGSYAFVGCSGMTSVLIGNSVTSIGERAFSGCTGLTSVVWNAIKHNDFSNAGYAPFYYIRENITSFTVGDSVQYFPARLCGGMSKLTSVVWNAIKCEDLGSSPFSDSAANITSFTVGDSVEYIPAYLCYGLSKLTSIEIPNSVTSIGNRAFSGCTGLTSIEIPNSVTSIGTSAFSSCSGITEVHISDLAAWCKIDAADASSRPTNANAKLYLNGELVENVVVPDGVESLGGWTFYNLSQIKSVIIPNSVTSLGYSSMENCVNLTDVVIGDGITTISQGSFKGCTALANLTMGNGIISIEDNAFYGCSSLKNVVMGDELQTIGKSAFEGCSLLESIYLGKKLESIGAYAFKGCSSITGNIVIPNSVTSIGSSAFSNCSNITGKIVIPNSVTSIGSSAFSSCSKITDLVVGENLATCGGAAFAYCFNLTTVEWNAINCNDFESNTNSPFRSSSQNLISFTIGNSVEHIPAALCLGMSKLTCIEIPNSVTSIGNDAFNACSGLKGLLTLHASIKSIGANAFAKTGYKIARSFIEEPLVLNGSIMPVTTLVVPKGTLQAYKEADYWKDINLIIEENSNDIEITNETGGNLMRAIVEQARVTPAYVTGLKVHGTLNTDDFNAIKSNMTVLLNLDISDTDCTELPYTAFQNKETLIGIALPNNLQTINSNAFDGCISLETSIKMPATVTTIGNYTFRNCYSLPAVEFSENTYYISDFAFQGSSRIKEIVLPVSLKWVGKNAFENCNKLTSLNILSTNLTINSNAFKNADLLRNVEMNSINLTIMENVFQDCNSLESVNISADEITIGNRTFENCISLTNVTLPSSLKTMSSYLFNGCRSLENIEFPSELTSIGESAFAGCSSITTINFPSSLGSIGKAAFSGCKAVMEMSMPRLTPPSIVDGAEPFSGVDNLNCVFSFPTESFFDYISAQYWGAFVAIEQKGEIMVEIEGGSETELAGNGTEQHPGCHIHFHKGEHKGHGPQHMPGMKRVAAMEDSYDGANAIAYSGSSVVVEGEECVTFVLTPQEGYEIEKVLYGGEDVTSQLDNNTFTTPVAEAGKNKKMQVILAGDTKYILGDANADLVVNVTDVVAITNHILGSSSENFQADAADANGDGSVNVTDVVAVTNIILGVAQVNELPSEDSTTSSELTLTDNGINDNGIQTIDVALFNDRDFTAFQADLRLPAGMELVDMVLSDRASSSHSMNLSVQADGSYRMISYSMVNEAYANNNGTLFTLVLKSTNAASGELVIEDIIFTTPQAIGYNLDDVVMEVAGTTALSTLPTDTRIYAQDGYIVIESPADCIAVISGVDGVARQVAVNAGMNTYAASKKGIYIVRSNDKVVKVIVK